MTTVKGGDKSAESYCGSRIEVKTGKPVTEFNQGHSLLMNIPINLRLIKAVTKNE
jgi:hypothetical protein